MRKVFLSSSVFLNLVILIDKETTLSNPIYDEETQHLKVY